MANSNAKINPLGVTRSSPDPAQLHFDNSRTYAPAQELHQIAQVRQGQDGTLAHGPRYSNQCDSSGKLRATTTRSTSPQDPTVLKPKVENLIKAYHGESCTNTCKTSSSRSSEE
ncbi:hypothetical protein ACIP5Y_24170 [Nocardia sp. NPDC088792]|uniref:hypothetical protein n=1 Tax=Nocardia sp. NPDC088792 TaxID=3364332 RepID=UPI00380E807F